MSATDPNGRGKTKAPPHPSRVPDTPDPNSTHPAWPGRTPAPPATQTRAKHASPRTPPGTPTEGPTPDPRPRPHPAPRQKPAGGTPKREWRKGRQRKWRRRRARMQKARHHRARCYITGGHPSNHPKTHAPKSQTYSRPSPAQTTTMMYHVDRGMRTLSFPPHSGAG